MDSIETGMKHGPKIPITDTGHRMRARIGGDPFHPGKPFFQMFQNIHQILGFYNQTVGILQKNRRHSTVIPVNRRLQRLHVKRDDVICHFVDHGTVHISYLFSGLSQGCHISVNPINIHPDVRCRAQREPGVLVHRAKGAAVPRTITGDPYQQAGSLAGRTYGALFKACIFI